MMNVVGKEFREQGVAAGGKKMVSKACIDMIIISKVRQDTWVLKRLFHVYHVFPVGLYAP